MLSSSSPAPSDHTPALETGGLHAVLGPTNTGKTHYALERMCAYKTGMIGLPLRLLAREIYDRLVAIKGVHAVALITGEEKIVPKLPAYFVATVEAMPLERKVEFLAVDEIQLCADPERGHVFTDRLLHARGQFETLFMGASTFAPLFKRLFPQGRVSFRDRLSALSYTGSKKLTRLPKRSAIIAFSTPNLYAIAELIRRQRGGAAVVMGSLSPRTRNAQVALFQNGEVDFLVATDAIGMGLNMNIDHVAFSAVSKFDGRRNRYLTAQEIAQIAGRAGRFTQSGTFGVTGEGGRQSAPNGTYGVTAVCGEMDEDLVAQVEAHYFEPLDRAQWRNDRLEFASLETLIHSLSLPSDNANLALAPEALDERALKALALDDDIRPRLNNPISLKILWETLQLPDFRKLGFDEYLNLIKFIFEARLGPHGIAEDWFAVQIGELKREDGDIDTLQARLSHGRTLNYIANRPGWLKHPEPWREAALDAENALSDRLHQALMQRFIDSSTSVLLKALSADTAPVAEVEADGTVRVEGEIVGQLKGFEFTPTGSESLAQARTLRRAAHRAVGPLLTERLNALATSPSKAFRLKGTKIHWNGTPIGQLVPSDICAPQVKFQPHLEQPILEARAANRIRDFVTQLSRTRLKPFWDIKAMLDQPDLKPEARGLLFRLYENGGIVVRPPHETLTPDVRNVLKGLKIRIGRFAYVIGGLHDPLARDLMRGLLTDKALSTEQARLSAQSQVRIEGHAPIKLKLLETLDQALSRGRWDQGRVFLKASHINAIGLDAVALKTLMKALGFHEQALPVEPTTSIPVTPVVTPAEPPAEGAEAVPIDSSEAPSAPLLPLDVPNPDEPVTAPLAATEPEILAFGLRPQKNTEPRRKAERKHRPAKTSTPTGVNDEKTKPKRLDKPGSKRAFSRAKTPKPQPPKPYVNPYSPFAILRERFGRE